MNIAKRFLATLMTLTMAVAVFGCVSYKTPDDFKPTAPENALSGLHHIEIDIQDDGNGFDENQKIDDGRSHVGIQNVRESLEIQ